MTISVVIPVFNEAEHLSACLEALAAQTRNPDEIIVVDNNCTDESASIASRYQATVVKEKTQGIWAASYAGYMAANSTVIARCDADSVVPRDWLECIERAFMSDPQLDALTGPGVFYGAPCLLCRAADIAYMRAYFWSVGLALGQPPLFGSNFAIRRNTWLKCANRTHHTREDIHDDIDLSYHLPPHSRVRYDKTLTVGISIRPFFSLKSMIHRYVKGFRSLFIHWPKQAPWNRR